MSIPGARRNNAIAKYFRLVVIPEDDDVSCHRLSAVHFAVAGRHPTISQTLGPSVVSPVSGRPAILAVCSVGIDIAIGREKNASLLVLPDDAGKSFIGNCAYYFHRYGSI